MKAHKQASTSKAEGSKKAKSRQPAEVRYRGSRGVKVLVSTSAKHSPEDVAADLREIADRLEGRASEAA